MLIIVALCGVAFCMWVFVITDQINEIALWFQTQQEQTNIPNSMIIFVYFISFVYWRLRLLWNLNKDVIGNLVCALHLFNESLNIEIATLEMNSSADSVDGLWVCIWNESCILLTIGKFLSHRQDDVSVMRLVHKWNLIQSLLLISTENSMKQQQQQQKVV